ncbi:hypothetical protein LUZ63_001059 [Rhynchospora breviuscula]|uniref:Sulfotransferase n=1 Tax=Rhynchospora breviuscula TaxID=2022672 RepID=A0A9Q0HX77_9POAL|nr:hypothetical protein LUZ63_001059 [Rhynchospora breviuscula]
MLIDPMNGVVRLANSIGCPFTEEEMKKWFGGNDCEFCSFSKLKNLDVNEKRVRDVLNSCFFRKAAVEDWQNYMTAEMADKLDEITKEKLCDSSFTY